MNIGRIFTLLKKEFLYGSHNFIFVMAVVMPVGISLLPSLLLGTLFSGKPRLGILDQGNSQLTIQMAELDFLQTATYASEETLRADVERGALDMALILPENFDRQLQADTVTTMDLFI